MKCFACLTDNRDGAKFCIGCGAGFSPAAICPSCNAPSSTGKFCVKCGHQFTSLVKLEVKTQAEQTPEFAPAPAPARHVEAAQTRKLPRFAAGSALVLILIAAGGGIYFYLGGSKSSEKNHQQVPAVQAPSTPSNTAPVTQTAPEPVVVHSPTPTNPPVVATPPPAALPTTKPPKPEAKVETQLRQFSCGDLPLFLQITCGVEGKEVVRRCAPDLKNWNHSIPGCDRQKEK